MFENSGSIAVIGMSFRLPGDVATENQLWQALSKGRNLVSEVSQDRWATKELSHSLRKEPGRSITFSAGVLSRIDEFDAEFFGISPREAAGMDPQQRLLLELAWETMENSGQIPSKLAGSNCAVYVGISSLDYGVHGSADLASLGPHFMTGNTFSIAANRLSYVFDLHGPSVAVDTACSSSLVALHHACNSIRAGEASSALVGGVNLLLHPYPFVGFTKASMLSEFGQSRAFDATGAGYVRAEGGVVLMLKSLDKAIEDGDHIEAVILASGINADGSRKSGMTIPSQAGQEELMNAVLKRSGLEPGEVDYIEAHGTGTSVGDPIEAAAIGAVYGKARSPSAPIPIGSVKTNLGHMEAASGMAGLVKAILTLKNKALPQSLHFDNPNPNIDFDGLNIKVVDQFEVMAPNHAKPMIVGVNSFGFGGANAHALLQEAPIQDVQRGSDATPPLFISAKSSNALKELAGRYADLIESNKSQTYYDVAYAAARQRDWLKQRLVVYGESPKQIAHSLGNFSAGLDDPNVLLEEENGHPAKLAFIYSGNGSQWHGMARQLQSLSPQFADQLKLLNDLMSESAGFSILAALSSDDPQLLDDTTIAQPLLFAIQVSLTNCLRDQGISPKAVAGHSVGEVAAAWASGALTLEQAISVICVRSRSQGTTRNTGSMASVGLPHKELDDIMAAIGSQAEIACLNSPKNVTISGAENDLELVRVAVEPLGIFFQKLNLDYSFHSSWMDPIESQLLTDLKDLNPHKTDKAIFVSTVTGEVLDGCDLDASYWWGNIRRPVLFTEAMSKLANAGCNVFLEIGPNAILQRYMNECLAEKKVAGRVLPILKRDVDELKSLKEAQLRIQLLTNFPSDLDYFALKGNPVSLPNYPWQKERHWHPETSEAQRLIYRRRVHPLLGWRLKDAKYSWENILDPSILPWIADHNVGGSIVFPGSAYVEMALAAAREWLGQENFVLEGVDILLPIVFERGHAQSIRLMLNARDGTFEIQSQPRLAKDQWSINAAGRIQEASSQKLAPTLGDFTGEKVKTITSEEHYDLTKTLSLNYGSAFQVIQSVSIGDNAVDIAVVRTSPSALDEYLLDPMILDACFQSLVDFFVADIKVGKGTAYLPVKFERITVNTRSMVTNIKGILRRQNKRSLVADFELYDKDGELVAAALGCRFQAANLLNMEQQAVSAWQMTAHLRPHSKQERQICLPSISTLLASLKTVLNDADTSPVRRQWHDEHLPLLDALSLTYIYEAFSDLSNQNPQVFDALLSEKQHPYIGWMINCLKNEGLLIEECENWAIAKDQEFPPAHAIWRGLLRESPQSLSKLIAIGRIGSALPKILTGQVSLEEMVAKQRQNLIDYDDLDQAPEYLFSGASIANALEQILKTWPQNQVLRILEISPSFSKICKACLDAIAQDHLEYTLAIPDADMVDKVRTDYAQHPNFRVIHADLLNCSIEDKSIELESYFDVIVLRHVTHQSINPRLGLSHCYDWLAPQGMLILAEQNPGWSSNFLNGIDSHWWHSSAAQGESISPSLVQPHVWISELQSLGFEESTSLSDPVGQSEAQGEFIIFSRKPSLDSEQLEQIESQQEIASDRILKLVVDGDSALIANNLVDCIKTQVGEVHVVDINGLNQNANADELVVMLGWQPASKPSYIALESLLKLTQQFGECIHSPRLTIITVGGSLISDVGHAGLANPSQSALSGMARVIMNEYPQLQCRLIDLSSADISGELLNQLALDLISPDDESEVILSDSGRFSPRLERDDSFGFNAHSADPYRLDFIVPGQLQNLTWLPDTKDPLSADAVEVETKAVGLNFRDVMYAMGLLRDEAVENGFAGPSLGLEFSGVVTRVGENVHQYRPGQLVMGFAPACFASHVVTTQNAIAPMPAEWSFASAATIPTTFFTAYYSLVHLARLQAGERVLIHGAAGGVGIAAIQLALYLGAEVYATAGSDEKRDFIRLLGVDHVFDSRSLDFADEILLQTHGQGVDVVLNSLAGEAIRRNLQVLRPFGRFLELGKRDFFENTSIGLRPFKDNISYFGIDADQLLISKPELAKTLFAEVMSLLESGKLHPLPYRSFAADEVIGAFRVMQQSRHIGKIVLDMSERPKILAAKSAKPKNAFSEIASWMVTGGLSGFGLESARWLAEQGVKNLVLVGRRGEDTPGIEQVKAEMQHLGVNLRVASCDISNQAALAQLLDELGQSFPAITGVIHAAAHFDDALIANLDGPTLKSVLDPKLLGAWNLHELTRNLVLDHFILYSSITTAIGNPGQANYVAANAGLEGLARMRRASGLAATCIGWGPIGDVGYLERNEQVKRSLADRLGSEPMGYQEALSQLEFALNNPHACEYLANFDWASLSRMLPSATSPRFEYLNRSLIKSGNAEDSLDIKTLIQGKSFDEVEQIVRELIRQELASILSLAPERIDSNKPLHDLGMDSLMGVELALGLERRFALRVPAMMLNGSPTLNGLGESIGRMMMGDQEAADDQSLLAQSVETLLKQHGEVIDVTQMMHMPGVSRNATEEVQIKHG